MAEDHGADGTPLPPLVSDGIEEVVLHIGMTKTGSTAIQNFLRINDARLLEHGLLVPRTGWHRAPWPREGRTAGHQFLLIGALLNGNRRLLEEARREIAAAKGARRLVFSAENLFHHVPEDHPRRLRQLFGEVPVRIIAYVRRQDLWVESFYNEAIAGGNLKETRYISDFWRDLHQRGMLDYDAVLQRWAEVFGEENLRVFGYEQAMRGEAADGLSPLLASFARAAGLQEVQGLREPDEEQRNHTRLDRRMLVLMRSLNELPFWRGTYKPYADRVHVRLGEASSGRRPVWLAREQRERILGQVQETNARLAQRFNGGEPLFPGLDDMCPPFEPSEIITAPPDLLAWCLREYAALSKGP